MPTRATLGRFSTFTNCLALRFQALDERSIKWTGWVLEEEVGGEG
jgi:hypothetical protein